MKDNWNRINKILKKHMQFQQNNDEKMEQTMNNHSAKIVMIHWLVFITFVNAGWAAAPQSLNNADGTNPLGMIFKFERQRDEVIAGIRKADETIAKAQNLISRAHAADNKAAETIAIRALQTAQEAKRKYEQKKIQIEKNSAYVHN